MIYLHFEDEILRYLPDCRMRCDGLASQLEVRADNHQKTMYGKKGEVMDVDRQATSSRVCEGKPANPLGGESQSG